MKTILFSVSWFNPLLHYYHPIPFFHQVIGSTVVAMKTKECNNQRTRGNNAQTQFVVIFKLGGEMTMTNNYIYNYILYIIHIFY